MVSRIALSAIFLILALGNYASASKRDLEISLGAGISTSNHSVAGVNTGPASFSYAIGADVSLFHDRPFGIRSGLNYHNANPQSPLLERYSVHEILFFLNPTYQFNATGDIRVSLGTGPAYGVHLNREFRFQNKVEILDDGWHLGMELRILFSRTSKFYLALKHFIPFYEGPQVRPTLILAGIAF